MFTLAFAVVEQENKSSWKWFLDSFFADYEPVEIRSWVFMSDKQKGLVELFKNYFDHVEHRYCVRHMYENMYIKHKNPNLKLMVWACAKAISAEKFEEEMEKRVVDEGTFYWLRQRGQAEWCKAFYSPIAGT